MSSFSSSLNLPVNGIHQWTIDRFISPYYAHNPSSQDWQDRIGVAWRVKIDYANMDAPFTYAGAGPVVVFGEDSTWEGDDLCGEESEITSECTVIADLPSRDLVGSDFDVDKPRNKTEIIEYKWENKEFCQVRMSIGAISFPQDESRIEKLLRHWQLRFGSIHWRDNQYQNQS